MAASQLQRDLKKKNPFDQPEAEIYLNLRRTHALLHSDFTALFRKFDITETQYNVLRILAGAGEGLPSLEISTRMVTQTCDITRLLDRMQDADLVERNRTSQDRRVVTVLITARGQKVLKQLERPVTELHESQLGHLSLKDQRQLIRLLEKARNASEPSPPSPPS